MTGTKVEEQLQMNEEVKRREDMSVEKLITDVQTALVVLIKQNVSKGITAKHLWKNVKKC